MTKNLIIPFFLLLAWSCSSTEPASSPPVINTGAFTGSGNESTGDSSESVIEINTSESRLDMSKYQSSLADTYSGKVNEIPEGYSRIKKEVVEDKEENLYEGFRIQIYSGQNVALADTMAVRFTEWSDSTITGYQAKTYIFFKAPYYRVHVGDFHDRNRAIYFSNLLKRQFRDAWVVYDRVNPWSVPPDSVEINFNRQ